MTLKIISSQDTLFEGEISSVTLPGAMGEFTVLRGHASLVSVLTQGSIRYTDAAGQTAELPVEGGVVDVDNDLISVCIY